MVFTFVNGEAGDIGSECFRDSGLSSDALFGEGHACAKSSKSFRRDGFIGSYMIGLGDFCVGLSKCGGKYSIVAEDDEASSGAIKATGEVELCSPRLVDEIDDGTVLGVAGGAEDSGRLVKQDIARGAAL